MVESFREISKENFHECIKLSVREDQRFVASSTYSIAESKIFPQWITKAIYAYETIVGFIMYCINHEEKELYLCRLMIDAKFQGKGYGKESLDILKDIAQKTDGIETIRLSTREDNKYGIRIYEKYGFVDTKEMDEDEKVFVLNLKTDT